MRETTSLISGKSSTSGGAQREVRSPYDGRVVCNTNSATPTDIDAALSAASAAGEPMRRLPHHERARILDTLAAKVAAARESLATLLQEEAGKPISLARVEADRCVQTIIEAARCARFTADEAFPLDGYGPGANKTAIIRRFPIGVIVAITPFNFPLNLVAHKIAPAIAAGCPLILKPASQTPSSGLELARLAIESGLPPGALSVLLLGGSQTAPLIEDPRVAMVTFTGSAEVGWGIKSRLPMKRVTLELGGNAAAIVEPDADLDTAAKKLASGAFAYAGQSCISVQRIFVHESAAARLTDALVAVASSMPHGDPSREETICGPLIDQANADRVIAWVEEAKSLGARVLCGGTRKGNIVAPTVVANAPNTARLNCNEVFGPVVNVSAYGDFDRALAMVNDSQYGLQAGIFTNDWRKIWKAFETVEVGGLIHNDPPTYRVDMMPYGGVKMSGIGREGPRWAIEEMTEPRLLVLSTV
jgi:glyceraldehyde-3-phosphate dehydrogenase (NADP+)